MATVYNKRLCGLFNKTVSADCFGQVSVHYLQTSLWLLSYKLLWIVSYNSLCGFFIQMCGDCSERQSVWIILTESSVVCVHCFMHDI